jgi:hypothetical protein
MAKQDVETATFGRTFIRDADKVNTFSKLSRYETMIERSLFRALHELQRRQAARRAEGNVPPPRRKTWTSPGSPGKISKNGFVWQKGV